jgi:integrase
MSPVPAAAQEPSRDPRTGRQKKLFTWDEIFARAPRLAATMVRYLDQLRVSARPSTLSAYDDALRMFAGHITLAEPACRSVAALEHRHIEAHKTWMASRPGRSGGPMSPTTISHRLCLLRTFFERIIDWDYDDAPRRCPIYKGDFPERDEPLPKFLDDPTAARFMAALATDPNKRRRLMVELLARTGMRAGELAALASDAMARIGDTHWLRIPVGKLHNDRYVPLHPLLVELIDDWLATRPPSRSRRLVERNDGKPFDRSHHPPLRRRPSQPSRGRSRASSPAPPHPGHPGHQPEHEPRSDRRSARASLDPQDPHLRQDLRPHRRRRVLPRHRSRRSRLPQHRTHRR